LVERVARLEQRVANSVVHGKVTDVDASKQLARVQIGEDENGQPVKSPWVPYGQMAGALKVHAPPSVGQNMTMMNPTGDPSQGILMPMTWNNANESPSKNGNENVLTYGNVRVELKNDHVLLKVGSTELKITGGEIALKSGSIKMDRA
jgi:phage baseplate assembly protein gpV